MEKDLTAAEYETLLEKLQYEIRTCRVEPTMRIAELAADISSYTHQAIAIKQIQDQA